LSLFAYNKTNLAAARKVCLQIELDMANHSFDDTQVRYGAKRPVEEEAAPIPKTTVECFETWTKDFKQLDCNVNSDYHHLRNTLRKWGEIPPERMLTKLNSEKFCPKTYNERLSMLKNFSHWMVKQGVWTSNPFEGVSRRKVKKAQKPDRKPFTPEEIR
jgi:integrase